MGSAYCVTISNVNWLTGLYEDSLDNQGKEVHQESLYLGPIQQAQRMEDQ